MNRILYILLVSLSFVTCRYDDVKNTYTISGKVGYPGNVFQVSHFTVDLILDDQIIASSTTGVFAFSGLEEGKSYIVRPQSDNSHDGLSTLDKVQLEKYLNGELSLDPFQKLAADVNRDNSIDQTDIDLIVNCILGNNQCFSWRFASENYDGNGTGYADPYSIPNLNSDQEVTFNPIKLGDVNGTVKPH